MDLNGDKEVPLEEVCRRTRSNFLAECIFLKAGKTARVWAVKMLFNSATLSAIFSSLQRSSGTKLKRAKVAFGRGWMPTASLRTCSITRTGITMGRLWKMNWNLRWTRHLNKWNETSCKRDTEYFSGVKEWACSTVILASVRQLFWLCFRDWNLVEPLGTQAVFCARFCKSISLPFHTYYSRISLTTGMELNTDSTRKHLYLSGQYVVHRTRVFGNVKGRNIVCSEVVFCWKKHIWLKHWTTLESIWAGPLFQNITFYI